ncbi:MAG TPA: ferritin [Ignavibacteriaceae bacterium]|jgi:ferritin|nr:ferritin [Ignavibacteriaceae bacterium]
MLNLKLEKALNKQINEELFASYLYLSMSAYFESMNLSGFAHWMKLQSTEEYEHAMKIYDYVFLKGGKVELFGIAEPKKEWESALNAMEDTLAHEQKVTKLINDLMDLAIAEKDHATASFLRWYVDEQVEEEDNATKILETVKMVSQSKNGLYMLDRELSKRSAD